MEVRGRDHLDPTDQTSASRDHLGIVIQHQDPCHLIVKHPDICPDLPECVTTVDQAVVSGHVSRALAREIDGQVVEVVNGAKTLLGGVVDPDTLLGLEGRDTVEGSVHVSGGDCVDTDLVASPFGGERLCELDNSSLGGIVAGLLLRVVDDAAGHGGNEDDAATVAGGDHVATDGLCDEERTGDVDV